MEVLKVYEYGDPLLLDTYDYNLYLVVLLATGERLRLFWQTNVKRYFNRTKPNYFTKSGEFKLQMPKRSGTRSVLSNALGDPEINVGNKRGMLPLLNVVKTSDRGSQIELVKLLMHGAGERAGMHFDGSMMRPGGTWKGFPASYWNRWDAVFSEECIKETMYMESSLLKIQGQNVYLEGEEYTPEELVKAYRDKKVTNIGGIL